MLGRDAEFLRVSEDRQREAHGVRRLHRRADMLWVQRTGNGLVVKRSLLRLAGAGVKACAPKLLTGVIEVSGFD